MRQVTARSVLARDPCADDEIPPDHGAYIFQNLHRETKAILKAAPVAVSSPVRVRAPELIGQLIVVERQVSAVKPAVFEPQTGLPIVADDLFYLGKRENMGNRW